jgi:hypothetical protein
MPKRLFGWLLILSALCTLISCGASASRGNRLDIKHGSTPVIDGILSSDEWKDAESFRICVEQGWTVEVLYKHDGSNLYIAFSNLVRNGKAIYPEILLDMTNGKTNSWNSDNWWFHVSYNDCEGNGVYSIYTFGNNGSCQKDHVDWEANNFPLNQAIIEIKIPYAKIGLIPLKGKSVGVAFDVTDATTNWYLWPASAKLESPSTWANAASSDGWK